MQEIRLWRIANSAQWVAWGIVQAKVEIEEKDNNDLVDDQESENASSNDDDNAAQGEKDGEDGKDEEADANEEEEFDYLAYAQERAYFFWGDVLQLGLVRKEDLPEELLSKIKIVRY